MSEDNGRRKSMQVVERLFLAREQRLQDTVICTLNCLPGWTPLSRSSPFSTRPQRRFRIERRDPQEVATRQVPVLPSRPASIDCVYNDCPERRFPSIFRWKGSQEKTWSSSWLVVPATSAVMLPAP